MEKSRPHHQRGCQCQGCLKKRNKKKKFQEAIRSNEQFFNGWLSIQNSIHQTAVKNGWWEKNRDFPEIAALIHSEVSEALEGYRNGNGKSEKIGEFGFSQIEEELADTIIRIMDYAKFIGMNIPGALIAKSEFNKSREYRHGNKKA